VSFYLIYLAIIKTGLKDPYRFLSRELKESHDNLRKSEEKYRSLFELMEEGFLRTDRNEIITMANLSMARLCGYNSPDEMTGHHIRTLYVHPEERDAVFSELLKDGVLHNREIMKKTNDGTRFWSLCNLKLITDENGNIIGTEELVRDITERKQASDDLLSEKKKLEKALAEIRTLRGIIPICCVCKKIRDDKGYWNQIEAYVKEHSDAEFSHGICPDCAEKFYDHIDD
jgi:PAS domain S-box-containing protein